jgi:hypothetical protein
VFVQWRLFASFFWKVSFQSPSCRSVPQLDFFPHRPLNAAAIGRCLQFCLVKAGFSATPASSRSIAASAALAGNASLGDVLRLGAWSDASSYFRFYHAL